MPTDPTMVIALDPERPGNTKVVPMVDCASLMNAALVLPPMTIRGNNTNEPAPLRALSVAEVQAMIGTAGPQGPPGPPGNDGVDGSNGSDGVDGAPGSVWTTGSGAPSGGVDGDFYLRTTNSDVYQKSAGSWSVVANIKGLTGDTGIQGLQGIQGVPGNPGSNGSNGTDGKTVRNGSGAPAGGLGVDGDFYIDTAANTIYGPKAGGAWGSATSIVGPQGIQGIPGNQGIQGNTGNTGAAGADGIGMMAPVKKTADEARTSNASFANDAALSFAVAANTKYAFRFTVHFTTNATADFKCQLAGPASPTLLRCVRSSIAPAATAFVCAISTAFAASQAITATSGTDGYIEINGILHNGANAGTVAFQWAQNTSDVGATTVRAGSFCEYSTI